MTQKNNENFKVWLMTKKCITDKSARDVISRLKRVAMLDGISIEKIRNETIQSIVKNTKFKILSPFIKSQLRRSVNLYCEYFKK